MEAMSRVKGFPVNYLPVLWCVLLLNVLATCKVSLIDGSAQIMWLVPTLRQKPLIKLAISSNQSIHF